MSIDPRQVALFNDFSGLTRLRASARADSKAATAQVARQFETIFTQMMLKSMRSASLGDGAMDSDQTRSYRDMFDQQLAVTLASRGKGLGIAEMLVRQLGGGSETAAATLDTSLAARAASTGFPVPARPLAMTAVAAPASDPEESLATRAIAAVQQRLQPLRDGLGKIADAAIEGAHQLAESWQPSSPQEFVKSLLPHAQAAAEKLGVSVRALLAHAALETGWGKHLPRQADGASSFNLFGIKAGSSWSGAQVRVPTLEVEHGVTVRRREAFRVYDSPSDSFMDYARLIGGNPRYAAALGRGEDVRGFARALQTAGYATDPDYARKLGQVADSAPMREALAAVELPRAVPRPEPGFNPDQKPRLQLDVSDSFKFPELPPSV